MGWTTTTATGLRNVHEREVDADTADVWELVETLATPSDRLWPVDRWPRLRLSDGVRPGSRGGHGPVRYRVGAVGPGHTVRFDLEPEGGLTGWHGFQVTATSSGSRLTHTLVLERPSIAAALLVVPLHDALIEDLLDQLEAVVAGRPVRRRRRPLPVQLRIAALTGAAPPAAPGRADRRRRRALAGTTAAVLGGLGVLHLLWRSGRSWPARDEIVLVRHVVGVPGMRRAPGALACTTVAAALGLTAGAAVATTARDQWFRSAGNLVTGVASAVLALRAGHGLLSSTLTPARVTTEYRALDLAVYSPLCLALAAALHRLRRPLRS